MDEFLSADPVRLGRPDVPPCSDAVDEKLVGGTPEGLRTDLIEILGEGSCAASDQRLGALCIGCQPLQVYPERSSTTKEHRSYSGHFSLLHSQ
jgi:hypothetical protein